MFKNIPYFLAVLIGILILLPCAPKVKKSFVKKLEAVPASYEGEATRLPQTKNRITPCNDKANYEPDPEHLNHTPMKYVRVNVHVMRDGKGGGNFPDKEKGRMFIKKVMHSTNSKLNQNAKMFLPKGNDTPVTPTRYQFELTPQPNVPGDDGIYFHDDDELFFMTNYGKKNISDRGVYKKYGIQKDSVLNIFLMGIHPDSVVSKTYKKSSNGIAFGKWTKIASWYYFMKNTNWKTDKDIPFIDHWSTQRLLNHELGHCLGLRHSWVGKDGCDDTPPSKNCWNYTKNGSVCDSLISNNIMDYTAHAGAWTPCQIATVHKNLSNKRNRMRAVLRKNWCVLDTAQTIVIRAGEEINWNSEKDLEGNIVIENGGSLTINCRVSIPPNGKIIVKPKGKLTLSGALLENDCGKTWEGIEVWTLGNNRGEVVMINDAKIVNAKNEIDTSPQ